MLFAMIQLSVGLRISLLLDKLRSRTTYIGSKKSVQIRVDGLIGCLLRFARASAAQK